jgi:hypothetical protein
MSCKHWLEDIKQAPDAEYIRTHHASSIYIDDEVGDIAALAIRREQQFGALECVYSSLVQAEGHCDMEDKPILNSNAAKFRRLWRGQRSGGAALDSTDFFLLVDALSLGRSGDA